MTVNTDLFVTAMDKLWTERYRNVSSDKLRAVWKQIGATFNRQIARHGQTNEGRRWQVLQPGTGQGKTQGLALYCSMLDTEDHPGVLIVTRLKTQADDIAATINDHAGKDVAVAYHTDARCDPAALAFSPVVVICHRAFELSLDAATKRDEAFSAFMTWRTHGRKLVVVDEALDIVEEAYVTYDDVRFLVNALPAEFVAADGPQMQVITTVEHVLKTITNAAKDGRKNGTPVSETMLRTSGEKLAEDFDLTELRQALRSSRLDLRIAKKNDSDENKRLYNVADRVLKGIQATLENWAWYSKKQSGHAINTARLIVPDDAPGAVILDATASSNLIYQLFEDRVEVVPVLEEARRYDNVTLHIARGFAVGKSSMIKKVVGDKDTGTKGVEGDKLMSDLQARLGTDRKVMLVCHKDIEPTMLKYDPVFAEYHVGHWNALDGRNDWRDCDVSVLFGLPYRDDAHTANMYMALQGPQSTEWLRSNGDRPWKTYTDIRQALRCSYLIVAAVQALNRTAMRCVVDQDGNCRPCDAYVLFPDGKEADAVIAGIVKNMPGIKLSTWDYAGTKKKVRRGRFDDALLAFARNMMPGKVSASEIIKALGMTAKAWNNTTTKLRNTDDPLTKALADSGVRYFVKRTGRTQRSYLAR